MADVALFSPPQTLEDEPSEYHLTPVENDAFDVVGDTIITVETIEVQTFLRSPQYGVPLTTKLRWLAEELPNGTPRYIGLFASMPTRAGVGGTECTGSSYARVSHSAWMSEVVSTHVARRMNNGEVVFPELTGDLQAMGWGAWDAASGGTLRAFGLLRNVDGLARVFNFAAEDTPRFLSGELAVGVQ